MTSVSASATKQDLRIAGFIVHSEYNHETFQNDIAMVITDKDIEFNNNVKPISLPEDSEKAQLYAEGAPITVIGRMLHKLLPALILSFHLTSLVSKLGSFWTEKPGILSIDPLCQEVLPNIVMKSEENIIS